MHPSKIKHTKNQNILSFFLIFILLVPSVHSLTVFFINFSYQFCCFSEWCKFGVYLPYVSECTFKNLMRRTGELTTCRYSNIYHRSPMQRKLSGHKDHLDKVLHCADNAIAIGLNIQVSKIHEYVQFFEQNSLTPI